MRTRRKICAGNWKMYKTPSETRAFFTEWSSVARPAEGIEVVIFPPAYNLFVLSEKAAAAHVKFGAQNIHYAVEGAYTGEISAEAVKSFGSQYVLLGHSERRTLFNETDELIAKKIEAALRAGLVPLLCVGEQRSERDAGQTNQIIRKQLRGALDGVREKLGAVTDSPTPLVIAYEPVWAIGTGQVASPEMAEEVHQYIRTELKSFLGHDDISILYGGSVKPENAAQLMTQPNIDGFLVGGASLKVADFMKILSVF